MLLTHLTIFIISINCSNSKKKSIEYEVMSFPLTQRIEVFGILKFTKKIILELETLKKIYEMKCKELNINFKLSSYGQADQDKFNVFFKELIPYIQSIISCEIEIKAKSMLVLFNKLSSTHNKLYQFDKNAQCIIKKIIEIRERLLKINEIIKLILIIVLELRDRTYCRACFQNSINRFIINWNQLCEELTKITNKYNSLNKLMSLKVDLN